MTPDHIMPPITDHGPLETMARAMHTGLMAYKGIPLEYCQQQSLKMPASLRKAGYAIVPLEPDMPILAAGIDAMWPGDIVYPDEHAGPEAAVQAVYRAMIAAATPIDSEKGE